MKIDAMTLGAVGFAAFAAYQTLKPATRASAAKSAADVAFGQAQAQRREVGAAVYQNSDALGFLNGTGPWAVQGTNNANSSFENSSAFFDGTGPWRL